jgi:hypothetical protein
LFTPSAGLLKPQTGSLANRDTKSCGFLRGIGIWSLNSWFKKSCSLDIEVFASMVMGKTVHLPISEHSQNLLNLSSDSIVQKENHRPGA